MAKSRGLVDRIGDAVAAATREAKTATTKVERTARRKVKTVATRVRKAAEKLEQAVAPAPAKRKPPTPGMKLDKGIAKVERAGRKARAAVLDAVVRAGDAAAEKTPRPRRKRSARSIR